MNFLISMMPTIVVLGILILIHELGHFLACRFFKVRVEKFSIGFGPEILKWKGRETEYVLSVFPIGGYVKPAGESVSELEGRDPQTGDYLAAPLLARIVIVSAGVIMNYLLAIFLFAWLFVAGRPVPGTVIGSFVKGYPAEAAGLMKQDKIVEVNGERIRTFFDLTRELDQASGDEIRIRFIRSDEILELPVTLKVEAIKDIFGKPVIVKRLGIMPSPEAAVFEKYPLGVAIQKANLTVYRTAEMTLRGLLAVMTGRMSLKAISGPIGIVNQTGAAAKLGLAYVLQLMATLSVSLAVINIFPIPALDGGHLFFLLIEGIRRKKVSLDFQERAAQVGFMLLLVLMGFVLYNDMVNLDLVARFQNLLHR